MSKATENHLESVTLNNFLYWKNETFHKYASTTTKNGTVELGCDGNGNSVVKHKGKIVKESLSHYITIETYKQIVRDNQ